MYESESKRLKPSQGSVRPDGWRKDLTCYNLLTQTSTSIIPLIIQNYSYKAGWKWCLIHVLIVVIAALTGLHKEAAIAYSLLDPTGILRLHGGLIISNVAKLLPSCLAAYSWVYQSEKSLLSTAELPASIHYWFTMKTVNKKKWACTAPRVDHSIQSAGVHSYHWSL